MLRTKSGLPKYCGWNADRHGVRRVRFRLRGFTTYIPGTPWSPEFMQLYAKALDGVKGQTTEAGASRTKAGSFNALFVGYYKSPEFRGLKASTQATRRNVIEHFRKEHGDGPVRGLKKKHISAIIGGKANTPEAANLLLKVLRVVLNYAVDIEMIESNPAIGVKRYHSRGEGRHPWSEEEVAQFERRHAIGSKARLALALGLYTAQRRSDAVRMGWQHVSRKLVDGKWKDVIAVRQDKTDTPLKIPMHPQLMQVLTASPRDNMTFLVTERGAPFAKAGFGNWFRDRCNEAGLPQCSFHGLRKTAPTRLANAGCSAHEIAAITGHKSLKDVQHYTLAADQERLAHQALAKQLGAEQEQDLSSLSTRLDKTGVK